jgi:hypothetical protein
VRLKMQVDQNNRRDEELGTQRVALEKERQTLMTTMAAMAEGDAIATMHNALKMSEQESAAVSVRLKQIEKDSMLSASNFERLLTSKAREAEEQRVRAESASKRVNDLENQLLSVYFAHQAEMEEGQSEQKRRDSAVEQERQDLELALRMSGELGAGIMAQCGPSVDTPLVAVGQSRGIAGKPNSKFCTTCGDHLKACTPVRPTGPPIGGSGVLPRAQLSNTPTRENRTSALSVAVAPPSVDFLITIRKLANSKIVKKLKSADGDNLLTDASIEKILKRSKVPREFRSEILMRINILLKRSDDGVPVRIFLAWLANPEKEELERNNTIRALEKRLVSIFENVKAKLERKEVELEDLRRMLRDRDNTDTPVSNAEAKSDEPPPGKKARTITPSSIFFGVCQSCGIAGKPNSKFCITCGELLKACTPVRPTGPPIGGSDVSPRAQLSSTPTLENRTDPRPPLLNIRLDSGEK